MVVIIYYCSSIQVTANIKERPQADHSLIFDIILFGKI